MEITFQKILEDYWSQTLLLLTAIGIILRMTFSFFLKKREINHGIVHKNRMDALIRFFSAYADVKSMWTKLPIFQIYRNELPGDEIDKQIQPSLNKFQASIIELQIYFDDKVFDKFKMIEKNMLQINNIFLKNAFEVSQDKTVSQKADDYYFFRLEIEKENSRILTEINKELSKRYK